MTLMTSGRRICQRPARNKLVSTTSKLALFVALATPFSLAAQTGASAAESNQQTAQADTGGLPEITVTAEFRETNLQKTPISITAVTGDVLRQRSITNIVQLAEAAPNVIMREGTAGFGKSNQAFIRGLGQGDFLYTYSPRVSFYDDEIYLATVQGSVFELLDIGRIEVLRGPQGTLFGRNAVGGAFRIFSNEPKGDGSGNIQATYGNYNHYDVRGTIDVPVVQDKLFLRMSAGYVRKDGYVTRMNWACLNPTIAGKLGQGIGTDGGNRTGCKVGTLGGTDVASFKAAAKWLIADGIENTIRLEYSDDNSEAPPVTNTAPHNFTAINPTTGAVRPDFANVPNGLALWLDGIGTAYYGLVDTPALRASIYPNNPYVSYAIYGNPGYWDSSPNSIGVTPRVPRPGDPGSEMYDPAISTLKTLQISNIFEAQVTDMVHLKSITGYRQYRGGFGSSQQASPWPVQEVYNTVRHHQFSEEVQLSGSLFDSKLDWTVGGFYLKTKDFNGGRVTFEGFGITIPIPSTTGDFGVAPFSIPFQQDFQIGDPATLSNKSGFAHLEWHITDRLNLTGGIRYSTEHKSYTFFRYYFWPIQPGANNVRADASESKWTPKISLDYQVTDDALVYASFGTGFTAGGINGRPFNLATDLFSFKTENVYSYEVGFKTEWLDRKLRVNGAIYYTQFKNMQLTLGGCPTAPVGCRTSSPFYVDNGGNSRLQGFELEAIFQPTEHWMINAGIGMNDFKFKTLSPLVNGPNTFLGGVPSPFGLNLNSPLNGQPKWTGTASTQYDLETGDFGTFTPRVDVVYRSTIYFDTIKTNPYTQQKSMALVNARLTWKPKEPDWSVSFGVTNLFDKLYYTNKADQRNSFGAALGTVAAPREWTITVRRDF